MKKILIYTALCIISMFTTLSCDDGEQVFEDTYTSGLLDLRILGPNGLTFYVDGNPPKGSSNPYVIPGREIHVEVINEETKDPLLDTLVTPELGHTINLHVFYLGGENLPEFIEPLDGIDPAPEGYRQVRFINLTTGGKLQGKTLDMKVYGQDGGSPPEYTLLYTIENIPAHTFTDFIELPTPETLEAEGFTSATSEIYDHDTGEALIEMEELYPDFFPGWLIGFNGGAITSYQSDNFSVITLQLKGDDRGETYSQEILQELSLGVE